MIRKLLFLFCILLSVEAYSRTIVVKNLQELNAANKVAVAGDIILLKNGEWKDVELKLDCNGTAQKPIIFKAETAGKVLITGHSSLKLGGNHLIIEGLYFTKGFSGNDPVISFRSGKDRLANNTRVTNCVINDFNNAKRMDENYWVAFYGKNNRLDHCSFKDKKNMGVLLAVILDDEKSRENNHSIDHNYFGRRIPLASNGGEIIRVGVSQHCQFNSFTKITANHFEDCDGEAEVISIKSGSNIVKENIFTRCQGSVVLRHGDNNTVENNIFLGNGKEGTGGVRVINKGQWVVNNFFYGCTGTAFRAPLAVMNGIPNSPAHRYVQVTESVIANNTFYACAPLGFGEGSDAERTLPPSGVYFINNLFYAPADSLLYHAFDKINGFHFAGNLYNGYSRQAPTDGFVNAAIQIQKNDNKPFPVSQVNGMVPDSLQSESKERLGHPLMPKAGFTDLNLIRKIQSNAWLGTGAKWFPRSDRPSTKPNIVNCQTSDDVYRQIGLGKPSIIQLTGKEYKFEKPLLISASTIFSGQKNNPISFGSDPMPALLILKGKGILSLRDINLDGTGVRAQNFIASDTTGEVDHYSLTIRDCRFEGFTRENGCKNFFFASKSMIADSLVVRNTSFENNVVNFFVMNQEKDNKGLYNAEKIWIGHNYFNNFEGILLDIYRGGNDESTMGPQLYFSHNKVSDCISMPKSALIQLTGVQRSYIFSNIFSGANYKADLIHFKDTVKARHLFEKNQLLSSGHIVKNTFVIEKENTIQ